MRHRKRLGTGWKAYYEGELAIEEYNAANKLYGLQGCEVTGRHQVYTITYANTGETYEETLLLISDAPMHRIGNATHRLYAGTLGDAVEFCERRR